MKSHGLIDALISVRCPYCIDGLEFRPMQSLDEGAFICSCGHTVQPRQPQFRCSCSHCACYAKVATFIGENANSCASAENPRDVEVLHSLNLLTFEEAMRDTGNDDRESPNRELEIKKQLVPLYEQEKAFAHPTPAEQPSDYEPEELEAWANMKASIEALENELAKLTNPPDHN